MLMAAGSDEDEDGRLEWDNEKWYNKARNYVLGIGAGKILKLPPALLLVHPVLRWSAS